MKVLVAVLCSSVNYEKLEDILKKFEQAGYQVYLFDKTEEQVESMIDLPNIIKYVKNEAGQDIQRIVIISNIKEFIFSWYRCYNSLVDDFLYYFDEHTNFDNVSIIDKIPHGDFYQQLYEFSNISKERHQGKIYLTIDLTNFKTVSYFLLLNNNFQFFADYCNFDFNSTSKKEIINKDYFYQGLQYEFVTSQESDNRDSIHLDCEKKSDDFRIDAASLQLLGIHHELIGYLLITIHELFGTDKIKRDQILLMIFTNIKFQDDIALHYLQRWSVNYLEEISIGFDSKINIISLLVALGIKENIYKQIMDFLLNDDKHITKHYPLLVSSLFYHSANGITHYKNLYHDRDEEFMKIVDFYKEKVVTSFLPMRKEKRIMIHIDQLLSLQHSPTMLTLNYAKYLKKYYPEYEIQIFVDDLFLCHSSEIAFSYMVVAPPSIQFKEIHEEFLQGLDISIYYSDCTKERSERIQGDLEYVYGFSPSLILGISTWFNIIRGFLYDHYPIVDMTVGGLSNSQKADCFIHCYEESYIEQECIKYDYNLGNFRNGKIVKYRGGVDFLPPIKKIKREEYRICEEDFVIVTVGNRLEAEMSNEFIDVVCSFLQEKSNAKWLIVGISELIYLKKSYSDLVNQQVIFIEYENDLAALYGLCDIYINPFRKSGGYSAGIAMNQKLPVVTLCTSNDVVAFTGEENSVRDIEEYLSEMQLLYKDVDYKKAQGLLMKRRLDEKFSFKNSIDDLVKIFAKAIDEFKKRSL